MEDTTYKITTSSGFEYVVDKDAMDDMELFEDLMTLEDPEAAKPERMRATNRIFHRLLGNEQKERLNAYLKERDGKVRISVYQREILELFAAIKDGKKK